MAEQHNVIEIRERSITSITSVEFHDISSTLATQTFVNTGEPCHASVSHTNAYTNALRLKLNEYHNGYARRMSYRFPLAHNSVAQRRHAYWAGPPPSHRSLITICHLVMNRS